MLQPTSSFTKETIVHLNCLKSDSELRSEKLQALHAIRDNHKIWRNPLLEACRKNQLTFEDFRFIFSQYYLYSKNFTRFLAALMVNCESDFYRSRLSENLWEEGGGVDIEQRHAEIFRQFLHNHLKIESLEEIIFEPGTRKFVHEYLHLCLHEKPLETAAALSLGTESIVPRLYQNLRQGLHQIGLQNDALRFFDLHIACDDDHALTLEELMLSYSDQEDWFERCKTAAIKVLDLRDDFFNFLYQSIQARKELDKLVRRVASAPEQAIKVTAIDTLISNTDFSGNLLYKNDKSDSGIRFRVERLPFKADVLDPRLVAIPAGYTNELHSHAHETVFLILEGQGEVIIGDQHIAVKSGDIVLVPRWIEHQTRNTSQEELRFFAITDYGFTKRFPGNNESVYRMDKTALGKAAQ